MVILSLIICIFIRGRTVLLSTCMGVSFCLLQQIIDCRVRGLANLTLIPCCSSSSTQDLSTASQTSTFLILRGIFGWVMNTLKNLDNRSIALIFANYFPQLTICAAEQTNWTDFESGFLGPSNLTSNASRRCSAIVVFFWVITKPLRGSESATWILKFSPSSRAICSSWVCVCELFSIFARKTTILTHGRPCD